ncbi:hypothetical protein AMTRI_Chr09g38710 [Amborella trichopoda]
MISRNLIKALLFALPAIPKIPLLLLFSLISACRAKISASQMVMNKLQNLQQLHHSLHLAPTWQFLSLREEKLVHVEQLLMRVGFETSPLNSLCKSFFCF